MSKLLRRFLLLQVILLLVLSCATRPAEYPLESPLLPPCEEVLWTETGVEGVSLTSYSGVYTPVGLSALAIALDTPGLEFVITPPDREGRGETRSSTVSSFAERHELAAAINGAPYDSSSRLSFWMNRKDVPCNIAGLHIYEGELISAGEASFDAFYVLEDGSCRMGSQDEIPLDTRWAVGGFHLALRDGGNLGIKDFRAPRSLIALSRDRRILYLVVIDGKQEASAGMTTGEAAEWVKWLGGYEALNLDGGGSSSLVLNTPEGIVLLNTPVHRSKAGVERAVASHIGIRLR